MTITIEEAAKRTANTIRSNRGEQRDWRQFGGYQCTVRDEPHLREALGGKSPSFPEYRTFEAAVDRELGIGG